ncbi:hemerythrin domain-containing protein [Thermopirellula anaerolimosa]
MVNPYDRVDTERFFEEHERIEALLEELETALAKRDRPPKEVIRLLSELPVHLEAHFSFEEAGRFFDEGMLRAPHLQPKADKILAEHTPLVDAAKSLAATASEDDQTVPEWWERVHSGFAALKNDLSRHEHAENDLVQEAYIRDLGARD